MSPPEDFGDQRLAATREFAQTMIVVDDEAWKAPLGAPAREGLRAPRRGQTRSSEAKREQKFRIQHALDTEKLIDAAMGLGLICSVIRPPKGKSIKTQVGSAAKRADIVCLDWELHSDGGDSATKIITEIVRSDEKQKGRLRLIAIYTGDSNNNQILEKVFNAISKSYRERFELKRDMVRIESNHGLRIVCLFKAHGVQLADARKDRQVTESALPERLQKEFALLAGGLLSNVALATIASIRDSTHHVLAKMAATMDAPYFHHRAILPMVSDAELYCVDIILSVLKSAVDKRGVGQKYAGPEAIAARIREMAGGAATLRLYYESNGPKNFDMSVEDAIGLVTLGTTNTTHGKITGNKPPLKIFKREMSSLFVSNSSAAYSAMCEFAVLTGIGAYPGSDLYTSGSNFPQLGLGTIIQNSKRDYYLCLQASCDSVRVCKRTSFLFVPLRRVNDKPDHVVPVLGKKMKYVELSAPGTAYAELISLSFDPDIKTQSVLAKKVGRRPGLFFIDGDGIAYRWVANLKQRRALRTAQKLGQSMGRIGFDEFEPFRERDG